MTARIPAIGSLRDRVQLRTKVTSSDGAGGHTISYVDLAMVWAQVKSLAGSFREQTDGRVSAISHTVVLRFRTDVKAGDQIIYRGRTLEVISANDLSGRRAYLSCACSAASVVG